jgi:ATP-dependent DNA helicase PIF1
MKLVANQCAPALPPCMCPSSCAIHDEDDAVLAVREIPLNERLTVAKQAAARRGDMVDLTQHGQVRPPRVDQPMNRHTKLANEGAAMETSITHQNIAPWGGGGRKIQTRLKSGGTVAVAATGIGICESNQHLEFGSVAPAPAAGVASAAAAAGCPWSHDGGGNGRISHAADSSRQELLSFRFDEKQKQVIQLAAEGGNIFLTGVAGTGKSKVTERIISDARAKGKRVAVAAPTGVAALNIGGSTLHGVAAIKVPTRAGHFGAMHTTSGKAWKTMDMLVLDEVGMIKADFLDFMDHEVRRILKRPDKPFGGIQLVFVGDFAQLGPVNKGPSLRQPCAAPTDTGADLVMDVTELCGLAFQTSTWREAGFSCFQLKEIHRQSGDVAFVRALMQVREGESTGSSAVADLLRDCDRPLPAIDGIEPTVLYSTNRDVDSMNSAKLGAVSAELCVYAAHDAVQVDDELVPKRQHKQAQDKLWRDRFFTTECQARAEVELKVGAQVMCVKNLDRDLTPLPIVNGSRGVVVGFEQSETRYDGWPVEQTWPVVNFIDEKSRATFVFRVEPTEFEREVYRCGTVTRVQIPLRLAWALTIHKAQGATLPLVIVDLRGCFSDGQAYVALSRATSRDGLQIRGFSTGCVRASALVKQFDASLEDDTGVATERVLSEAGLWWHPLVQHPQKHARWLDLFREAEGNTNASRQFREWQNKYPAPLIAAGAGSANQPPANACASPRRASASAVAVLRTPHRPSSAAAVDKFDDDDVWESPGVFESCDAAVARHSRLATKREGAGADAGVAKRRHVEHASAVRNECRHCERFVAPGLYLNRKPFKTCCRGCASAKHGAVVQHDVECDGRHAREKGLGN